MARKIRFPLKMKNGAEVRTLDELKENFDLESVLGYFTDGKLATWLEDRYYDVETQKVSELDANSSDLKSQLCAILGVKYAEAQEDDVDIDVINRRNEKKHILSQLTDDAEVLNNIDSVALNQDDLLDCYDLGLSTIYLVGDTVFSIPVSVTNVTYIGLCGAKAEIRATDDVDFTEKNITFEGVSFIGDIKTVTSSNNADAVSKNKKVDCNSVPECDGTNFKELLELAKNGNAAAEFEFSKFMFETRGCKIYLERAAKNDNLKAMYYLTFIMNEGRSNQQYRIKAFEYCKMAAEKGHVLSQYILGSMYDVEDTFSGHSPYPGYEKDKSLAYEWIKKAAEQGHIFAQRRLGEIYYGCYPSISSKTVDNIFKERREKDAIFWWRKASDNADPISREYLKVVEAGEKLLDYKITEIHRKFKAYV